MATCYLSLGSNLGDKHATLQFAVEQLEHLGHVSALSSYYLTAPWGYQSDNLFLNQVASLETQFEPHKLLTALQQIEQAAGRTPATLSYYSDRPLDIDLLVYDERIISDPILTLPHPKMHLRQFVLIPFTEIAPNLQHPLLHQTIEQLLAICPDTTTVIRQIL
jgi:2-amino-4-hydroxy-6-hydroxymethyldihydropteridine diphosphokinase